VIKGGYVMRLAFVNLSDGSVKAEAVDEGFAVKYIGGRGWGAKLVYDTAPGKVEPFSAENRVVVSSGPLSGLPVPCSGKVNFSAFSPATGFYGDSNAGGDFAVELKRAGFDALIVEGVAKETTYILVEDGEVSLMDAKPYWGMPSIDAESALKRDVGGDVSVAVIGPAGENLVKYACISTDFGRQAARCGIAAVMGFKRVKAIAAKGNGEIPVADVDTLRKLWEESRKTIVEHPDFTTWRKQGTMKTVAWANEFSCLPTRNFSEAVFEGFKAIDGEAMETRTRVGSKACYRCEMPCGQISQAEGIKVEGPEYETAAMIGSNCALTSIEEVVRANYICDQLGLDTISMGNAAAFAMECFEKGLITRDDTGGLDLRFGNAEALYALFGMVAYRKGLGNVLAEGVAAASKAIGKGSERFAMHVKGLEISGYDVRAAPAMGLAYATCDIGAHHNRAWAIKYDVEKDRATYGEDKVQRVIYLQHLRPMFDCLGVCRFPWVEFSLNPEFYARFYSAATGVETSLNDLLQRSEAVWNLTRLISLRQGLKADMDWLPERVFEDPIPEGPLKGSVLSRSMFKQMVKQYYAFRGWDENGLPTEGKLKELGLN